VRAVVDAGAHLIASLRMGGAWLGSIEIAQNKAYTARAFDMTTKDLAKISQPGQPASGIAVSTRHRVAIFPGGIPLKAGDRVIGAIGVSGGTRSGSLKRGHHVLPKGRDPVDARRLWRSPR
jgi:uncharacterized protein GlcG (DUF336 family)